jgi:hypothetical protein
LKEEIKQLVKQGDLDADLIFVSKYFHVEYDQIEKNLRPVLEKALQQYAGNVILVYGDLCLGMDSQMKKLAEEYNVVKVDAVNCVDCQLGGKGTFLEADPDHDLMFLSPGMTDFFDHVRDAMRKENLDEDQLKQLFSGLRGIVLLDTLGKPDELKAEVEKLNTGLCILETRQVGLKNVRNVLNEAVEKNKQKRAHPKTVTT